MSSRVNIIGTNQTTPGAATAPSTLLTDTSSTTGLLIKQGAGAPASQVPLRVVDSDASTIFEVRNDGHPSSYGMRLGASVGVFNSGVFLNGQSSIPYIEFPDGTTNQGQRWYGGTGAPSVSTVNPGRVGDLYFRKDTPSTANQRLYICTVAGTPGTWVGIA